MSNQSGVSLVWYAEHRKANGDLVSRQGTIASPTPLTCVKNREIWRFLRDTAYYVWLIFYHKQRVRYCEKNPNKTIPLIYRTGEGLPTSIAGMVIANIKLLVRRVF